MLFYIKMIYVLIKLLVSDSQLLHSIMYIIAARIKLKRKLLEIIALNQSLEVDSSSSS